MTPKLSMTLLPRGLKMLTLHSLCDAGWKETKNFNPYAIVDWMAYQGAPVEGMAGIVKIQKWWSGTNCADVNFPNVGYSCFYTLFVRDYSSRKIFKSEYKNCMFNLNIFTNE